MKTILLTQGHTAMVDDEDFDRLAEFSWYAHKQARKVYAGTNVWDGKQYRTKHLHRMVMDAKPGIKIDHKDGNGLNCQKENLRNCNNQQNCSAFRVKKIGTSSQFRGVFLDKRSGLWASSLCFKGKRISLGLWYDEKEAAEAYDVAARKYFGEFASPNFPI